MDELALARAELARLEAKAENLLQQLLETKDAAATQRTKINELVRRKSALIDQLPAELLLEILSLSIPKRSYVFQPVYEFEGRRKEKLARVSRRWRDIILGCPSLWTTIEVGSTTPSPKVYLGRSRDAPLDIIIRCRPRYGSSTHTEIDLVLENLAILITSAPRWRSMAIIGDVGLLPVHNPIVRKFNRLTFPSLKSVIIHPCQPFDSNNESTLLTYPDFLSQKRTPALEHMELDRYLPSEHFRTVDTLKSLKLTLFSDTSTIDRLYPRRIPTESLTTLSLAGNITTWTLLSNSIHFPVLHTLTLQVIGGKRFIEAIVVPNLKEFVYGYEPREDRVAVVFGDLVSKFDHVHRFSFSPSAIGLIRDLVVDYDDAVALSHAFPSVRHAELDLRVISPLFDNDVESWECLESLTFDSLHNWLPEFNRLMSWLERRQQLGRPRLRLKFTSATFDISWMQAYENDVNIFARSYEDLQKYCILELADFLLKPNMYFSMEGDSPLKVHIPQLTSRLINDINIAILKGNVRHSETMQF
ncbi:hypothetical protein J3A83DRAFT_4376653 [Scleroderma citrinum]